MREALFAYHKADTPVHRLPAAAKLVCQLALCIALFASPSSSLAAAVILVACGGVIAIAFAAARISVLELRRLRPILALGGIYAAFRVFAIAPFALRAGEIPGALLYIYRFFMSALSALVFFETTSPLQIKAAFEDVQECLAKVFPPLRRVNPALTLALAINFIPKVFSTWERVDRAARARCPKGKGATFFAARYYCELIALLSCLIGFAETARRALANRSPEQAAK